MSNAIFPALPGLAIGIKRSPKWLNRNAQAVSGKETRVAFWSYPEWWWEIPVEMLRAMAATAEFQGLASFYNALGGDYDSFLYEDPDDNAVAGQLLGVGDGATVMFQMVRTMGGVGGFVEPIWAPNQVTAVYFNGVAQAVNTWSVSGWGSANPGKLTFTVAPPAGAEITADFSYWFAVRFTDGQLDFTEIAMSTYSVDKVAFKSLK